MVDLWGGRWLWAMAVDLPCGLLMLLLLVVDVVVAVVVVDDNGGRDNILF